MMLIRQAATLAFLLIPALAMAGQGPRIVFDRIVHDYGKIRYGETVTEDFTFTNVGDETLVIEKLRTSCGCTTTNKGSTKIPPGGKSTITVAFDTVGLRAGVKKQTVDVHSNDPKTPVLQLTVRAEVVRDLTVDPPTVAKELSGFTDTVSFPVQVNNNSNEDVTVKGVKSQTEGVMALLQPEQVVARAGARTSFTLVLKPQKEAERHYYLGKVSLLTDHPRETEAEIRYLLKFDKLQ